MQAFGRLSQEQIVFALALLLGVAFAIMLPGFLSTNNLLNLVRSVSILGILGVAMGLVVIGRGIDLSLVALMAVSVAWTLQMVASGMPLPLALAIG
ncbi:MAG: ABC transporter permease, partial [Mesorhizobium sp.]|nr:ABC transporter permease [Mesorhizobium sp.]